MRAPPRSCWGAAVQGFVKRECAGAMYRLRTAHVPAGACCAVRGRTTVRCVRRRGGGACCTKGLASGHEQVAAGRGGGALGGMNCTYRAAPRGTNHQLVDSLRSIPFVSARVAQAGTAVRGRMRHVAQSLLRVSCVVV